MNGLPMMPNPMGMGGMPMQQPQQPQFPMNQLYSFAQQFQTQNPQMDPRYMVQQMINNGQMTQQQYNQYREIANRMTGLNM